LSVSGPAAGLTAICAAAMTDLGSIEIFFLSVALAGMIQILLGLAKLGAFTHFIPSAVIKGMLAAIGIMLIAKQIPLVIGYDQPDFWTKEFFNIITFNHSFDHIRGLYLHITPGAIIVSILAMAILIGWKRTVAEKIKWIPASFITVFAGATIAYILNRFYPPLGIDASQYVSLPKDFLAEIHFADISSLFSNKAIWSTAIVICFVASLETLLSITAIDKLDPYNRVTPQNRELVAQGIGNVASGLLGGLPITAVIVRSSANAEAGAKTRLSSFSHGVWLLFAVLFAVPLLNYIPYCVLAVILIRTGYNLAKPKMIMSVYRQGREQFMPFIVTLIAILLTDILVGVAIGCIYAIYFLIKHTYRAGFVVRTKNENGIDHYTIDLALNVSFLNKKRFVDLLDSIPEDAVVEINGTDSVYIDLDILEVFHDFKAKAHQKNIRLTLIHIPDVETIELHS
jgi:MFS superfamily sulfate permease-like transporter